MAQNPDPNVTAGNLTLTGPIPIQKEKYPLFFGEKGKDDIKISDLLSNASTPSLTLPVYTENIRGKP